MKSPNNWNTMTLGDHIKYSAGNKEIQTRLEICYYLYYPLSKAYDPKFWE